jgi:hypothetical protein
MKKILFLFLLSLSFNSYSQSWVLISNEGDMILSVDKSSIRKESKHIFVSWRTEFPKFNGVVFQKSLLNCQERESSLIEMIAQEPSGNQKKLDTNNLGWEFVPKSNKPVSVFFDYVCSRGIK